MSELRARGLGRGLSALLGEVPAAEPDAPAARSGVRELDISSIRPNPKQPRRHFSEEAIAELAESVAKRGVLQPILVREAAGGGYEIVAGERRWRAAQRAQIHRIPAIVRDFDEAATAEIALIENIQREDLNALEEAEGYRALITTFGHSQDGVAKLVHKSRSHVANLLRLLDLPTSVRDMLVSGELTMGHARAILSAADPDALARQVVAEGLSVRQTEQLARAAKPGRGGSSRAGGQRESGERNADIAALERQLGDLLGLKVKVAHSGGSGSVTLNFSTLDQLDLICQRLSGEPI